MLCRQGYCEAVTDGAVAVRLDEMGFIFQQMYMMKNLTILDNILLPAMESKRMSGRVPGEGCGTGRIDAETVNHRGCRQ